MDIKIVSSQTGVPDHKIKSYELAGLIPLIEQVDPSNQQSVERLLQRIRFIAEMLGGGMAIANLRRYLELLDEQIVNTKSQKALLQAQVNLMIEQQEDLRVAIDHLNYKLAHFDDRLVDSDIELTVLEQRSL